LARPQRLDIGLDVLEAARELIQVCFVEWNERVAKPFPKGWATTLEAPPMNATARTLFVLLLGSGYAGSALAAMDSDQTTPDAQVPAHMSQKLHDDLIKAGFTAITIMPASLIVRAKDAQGNSIMMVINPDSLTDVAEHAEGPPLHKEAPLAGAIKGAPNSPIPSPAPKQ
jgi:hypothetical protein